MTSMKLVHIQQVVFLALLVLTTGLFLWMLGPYLIPVLWAIIIALVFYPAYQWVLRATHGRATFAALLTITGLTIGVVGPLAVIGGLVVQDSFARYERVSAGASAGQTSLLEQFERMLVLVEPYGITEAAISERVEEWTASISRFLSDSLLAVSQFTFKFAVQIGIMVYLLFFFFRDGPTILRTFKEHLPLERAYEDRLLVRFGETTRAVIKGTLTVSILQGLIIGVTFWLVGISSPVLWGVAVVILALIPVVGAALVWLPAGLLLLFTGAIGAGFAVLSVGAVLMTFVDEFLRPILVGRNAKMPDAIILLATLGGLSMFGISGFVIGPVIAAFFLTLWTIFKEKFRAADESRAE